MIDADDFNLLARVSSSPTMVVPLEEPSTNSGRGECGETGEESGIILELVLNRHMMPRTYLYPSAFVGRGRGLDTSMTWTSSLVSTSASTSTSLSVSPAADEELEAMRAEW